ncbi:MAG: hypothetical protein QOK17_1268, partial [Sphingomonadales bacterium]|nr:hypothetical protein [Sphingomonadales bacterium]
MKGFGACLLCLGAIIVFIALNLTTT